MTTLSTETPEVSADAAHRGGRHLPRRSAPRSLRAAWPALLGLCLAMLVEMLGWIIDSWRLWAGVKKQLNVKYPGVSRKGLLSYLNNRAMTPRRWRNPVPRVERGSHRRA